MSNHMPGFQSFLAFLHNFLLAELASSSIRVKRQLKLGIQVVYLLVIYSFIYLFIHLFSYVLIFILLSYLFTMLFIIYSIILYVYGDVDYLITTTNVQFEFHDCLRVASLTTDKRIRVTPC